VGVDEVTQAMYAADLEANLQDLSARLKRMGYRPQPKRRIYIPKPGSETGRPLGISSFEDKIVELATKRVLEPLFEPLFEECSYGYRPQRSPHQCLDILGRTLQHKRVELSRRVTPTTGLQNRAYRRGSYWIPGSALSPGTVFLQNAG